MKKKKHIVIEQKIQIRSYEVVASSSEEAIELMRQGKATLIEGELGPAKRLDSVSYDVHPEP